MKYIVVILSSILISCLANLEGFNPVRDRVTQSTDGSLESPPDITIGTTSYTFSVVSDVHTRDVKSDMFNDILTESVAAGDQMMFVLGDLVDWGKENDYNIISKQISDFTFPHGVHVTIGNHDQFGGGWKHFRKYFGPTVYTFASETIRFIVLDTGNDTIGLTQFEWLENVLRFNDKDHTIVLTHSPPYTGTMTSVFRMASQEEVYRLFNLLKTYNVKYLFCGNLHLFHSFKIEGLNIYITGRAGAGLIDTNYQTGYLRVTVDGDNISVTQLPK